ncbi:Transcription factor [Mactra antiquata]
MVGTKGSLMDNNSYLRKIRKPMIEKKRRDRMNQSIEMLKTLISDTIKQQTAPLTKLDKAEILELTVYHLTQAERRQHSVTMATESTSYNQGFKDCAKVAIEYMQNNAMIEETVTNGLNRHLHITYTSRDQRKTFSSPNEECCSESTANRHMVLRNVNRLSTPVRENRVSMYPACVMNTPTFSPIVDPNVSLPHLSGSFVRSNLEMTHNSSMSTNSDMSISDSSSGSGSLYEGDIEHTRRSSASSIVTIGDQATDTVGHVIRDTPWRPW